MGKNLMPAKLNLEGKIINNIKFINFSHIKNKTRIWNCECYCGKKFQAPISRIKNKNTKSCGCLSKSILIKRNKENRKWKTSDKKMYAVWHAMINRCYNKDNWRYKYYGGRGILVCESWQNFDNYYNWIKNNLGDKSNKNDSIDRINNDGNYEPGNIRWATKKIQSKNKRGPKLTAKLAEEIRSSDLSRKEISKKYNVAESQISRIINNKRWIK
jgi:hypothetical protein